MEYIVTGGAITNKDTIDFLKRCFKVNVFDGYGTTETAGIAVDDAVVPDCTMRLEDVPELGYLTTDKPFPRGEIVVKTPHTIPGYYKDAKATYVFVVFEI